MDKRWGRRHSVPLEAFSGTKGLFRVGSYRWKAFPVRFALLRAAEIANNGDSQRKLIPQAVSGAKNVSGTE